MHAPICDFLITVPQNFFPEPINEEGLIRRKRERKAKATQYFPGWQLMHNKALGILKEGNLVFPSLGEAWNWRQSNSRGQI